MVINKNLTKVIKIIMKVVPLAALFTVILFFVFLYLNKLSDPFTKTQNFDFLGSGFNYETTKLATIPIRYQIFSGGGCGGGINALITPKCLLKLNTPGRIKFSPAGNAVSYQIGPDIFYVETDHKIVINDKEIINRTEWFSPIRPLETVFSPDGSKFAYIDVMGDTYTLSINGDSGPAHYGISLPYFNKNGNTVAYFVFDEGYNSDTYVIVNDKKLGPYESILGLRHINAPVFILSDDGEYVFYRVEEKLTGEAVPIIYSVADNIEHKIETSEHTAIHSYFSSTDKGFIGDIKINLADEKISFVELVSAEPTFDSFSRLVVILDLETGSYRTTKANTISIPERPYYPSRGSYYYGLALSRDGSVAAYIDSRRLDENGDYNLDNFEHVVIVGGKRSPFSFDRVYDIFISPDEQYVGYGAKKGRELWWVVEKIDS